MKLTDIYLVSHKRTQVSEDELANLKGRQDYTFPDDICDFLRKFGPGEYCGCFYFFKPEDLLNGQASCRKVWNKYFFFDRDKSELSQKEVLRSTWVGRTLDGDEVVYQPTGIVGYYVLPRHSDAIMRIGGSLSEVLEWFSSAGTLYRPKKTKWFCTFKDRCRLHIVKDEELDRREALSVVNEAFGVNCDESDDDEEFSIFFCQKISGYVHVYADNLDIHYDSDFDTEVCRIAEERFYGRGFRSVEHHCP
jgi:hypothetical protein